MAVGRYREAIPELERAIGQSPGDARPMCHLANALYSLGDHRAALRTAQRAAAAGPAHEWPHRIRSAILLRNPWQVHQALDAAREAVRLRPDLPETLTCLARAQLATFQSQRAAATAAKVLALAPSREASHNLVGDIASGRHQWAEAERHYRNALRIAPRSWTAIHNVGRTLEAQGRSAESIGWYFDAARANPGSGVAWTTLNRAVDRHLSLHLRLPVVVIIALATASIYWPPIGALVLAASALNWIIVRPRRLAALPSGVVTLYEHHLRIDRWRRMRDQLLWSAVLVILVILTILLVAGIAYIGHVAIHWSVVALRWAATLVPRIANL